MYHRAAWAELIRSVFGHETHYLWARDASGEIVGVLPLVRLKSVLFGDFMISVPFVNYGGAVGESPVIESTLLVGAAERAERLGLSHIEFRDVQERATDWPVRTEKVAMELSLPAEPEELARRLGAKVRAQYKRPLREGAVGVSGGIELLPAFYEVFSKNMRDLGTPVYSRELFAAIFRHFDRSASVHVVLLDERPVAAGLLLRYKGRTEVPWASSLREFNRIGVNMMLYWEMLKSTIEAGCTTFDFGRSTVDGATARFKKQWGAEAKQLYWYYWLRSGGELPKLNPSNPKYALAISAWKRLPLFVANRLGPPIVKYLP